MIRVWHTQAKLLRTDVSLLASLQRATDAHNQTRTPASALTASIPVGISIQHHQCSETERECRIESIRVGVRTAFLSLCRLQIDRKIHCLKWESNPSASLWLSGPGLRPLSYRDTLSTLLDVRTLKKDPFILGLPLDRSYLSTCPMLVNHSV